jgi:LAS superfamily LD-carboxypeptidase LdcB
VIAVLLITTGAGLLAGLSAWRAPDWRGAGYVSGQALEVPLLPIDGEHFLRPDAAQAFLAMAAAAARDGIRLVVNRAFATNEEQAALYQKYLNGTGNLAARPGYSNHQGGIAVDIATGGESSPVYRWLAANAAAFGFKRTVSSEPWHWEYRPGEVKRA